MIDLGVVFLAISIDTSFTHKAWQEHELSKMIPGGVPFPLLSDLGGGVGRQYGVYDEGLGLNLRGSFIIDPDGVVQASEILAAPVGRNIDDLIRQVKAFQHARETGEGVPCEWQPGDSTLQPGPELVGKVWEEWKVEK